MFPPKLDSRPVAHQEATITGANYRITVLTDGLLRRYRRAGGSNPTRTWRGSPTGST